MPNRLLVPALITGMILTVRITTLFNTMFARIWLVGCLQLPLVQVPGNNFAPHFEPILMLRRVQDMQCVENCDDPDPKRHLLYEQPVWQTLQMFRTCPTTTLPIPLSCLHLCSQLEKCFVCPLLAFLPLSRTDRYCPGFLPVLFTTLSARWRTLSAPSIRLPDEPSDDDLDGLSESQKYPVERLTGRRILLLWLPALCDLTGTTVRTFLPPTRPELLTYAYVRLGSTAHECWPVVYPRVNLSNDSWCTSAFRWGPFRAVPPPQAVSIPVSYVLLCAALTNQRVLQMALIADCHGGSVLGRI